MSARVGVAQGSHKQIHTADEVEWMEHASCGGIPVDMFFPPPNANVLPEVKRLCRSCEVRSQCLNFAIEYGEWHGVWGGLTTKQRRHEADRRRLKVDAS